MEGTTDAIGDHHESVVFLAWVSRMAHHGEFCKAVEHRHPYSKAVSHLLLQRSLYLVKPLAPPSCNSLALFIWFSGVGSRAKANSRMSKSACTRAAMPLATRLQICVLVYCLFLFAYFVHACHSRRVGGTIVTAAHPFAKFFSSSPFSVFGLTSFFSASSQQSQVSVH